MTSEQRDILVKSITDTFMWSFKKGDNIIYNFEIIWELYSARNATKATNKHKYIKPIVLLEIAIVECILDDFVNRVQGHVNDTIPNITQEQIADFRIKKRDQLEQYIAAAKKHDLFNKSADFYEGMDALRKARNRFHIQNSRYQSPSDEYVLFNNALLERSEKIFETVLHIMMTKFYRWDSLKVQPSEVPLPWND